MPAVGLALLLVVMLKKENAIYLVLGFVLINITNCQNILPVALIAAVLAYISYERDVQIGKLTAAKNAVEGDDTDGI